MKSELKETSQITSQELNEIFSNPLKQQVDGNHYKHFIIQPVEFITLNKIPYIEGNIIKYACRWREKGGIRDLNKIKHYVDLLLKLEEK